MFMTDARVKGLLAICVTASALTGIAASRSGELRQTSKPPVFDDVRDDRPGDVHRITLADLPGPSTESVFNQPRVTPRPEGALPKAPDGYTVSLFGSGLDQPRLMRTAPNGDLFVAESRAGRVSVFRPGGSGSAPLKEEFAAGLTRPFGIAFYPDGTDPKFVYIANTNSVVRFAYENGDLKARGAQEVIVPELPGGANLRGGGHWTRDIAFSRDGKKMFVSVGSYSNNDDPDTTPRERERATILEFNPDGSGRRIYVSGIRNAVGLAVHPESGELWASVNERDGLGDNLVPDFITSVKDGDFFGWPWFYMGGHQDPKHAGKHPELKDKVRTPDVLIQPHSASLQMVFYTASGLLPAHRNSIYAALHGSWNRTQRTGYKVIRVPMKGSRATGEYEDFLTGFVTPEGQVWGRPVGVAVGKDGALFVSDDGSNSIWRVSR
jgi:glucose/arabinose dehydrogenase